MSEIYVSVDIECDGPCPGLNSMLSIGAVAFDPKRGEGLEAIVGQFTVNLETLTGASPDQDTSNWWAQNPEAFSRCREDIESVRAALPRFADWLESLPGKPIFVGYPAGFDFTFIYWYLHNFAGRNPFVRNAIDLETYVMALQNCGYLESGPENWPSHWVDTSAKTSHVALEDALQNGLLFLRILSHSR